MVAAPLSVLISWIGQTDLNASLGDQQAGLGPLGQAIVQRSYDAIVLLSNYPDQEAGRYTKWLRQQTQSSIACHPVKLSSPTNFGEIYEAVVVRILTVLDEYGEGARLTYHLSPGTPAMAAVWIIVAKTRFAAELIESSKAHGVRTANVPFDISAEFLPDLLKRPDRDLMRLSAGIVEEASEFGKIVCRSAAMKRVIAKAQKVAPRSVPVLIEGESGTGKELLARAIHEAGPRRAYPFIAVNCGAIPGELAESELFGHKKGAFTGASSSRKGHFETANEGTLFLDEIGELPLSLQVKLLRVLQEGHVVRIGESEPISVNVRIISATNRTLSEEVTSGRFREDLFFRLAVAVIRLPPLRSRAGDIGLLVDHLMDKINRESAAEPAWENKTLSAGARNLLLRHPWSGNIRELASTLTRAAVWTSGSVISQEDIQDALLEAPLEARAIDSILGQPIQEGLDLQELIANVARHYLERAIEETNGNRSKAAELLGLGSYQTLNNWTKKYNAAG